MEVTRDALSKEVRFLDEFIGVSAWEADGKVETVKPMQKGFIVKFDGIFEIIL